MSAEVPRTFGDEDGHLMQLTMGGNVIQVLEPTGEPLFSIMAGIGTDVDSALRAAVTAYYRGRDDGEEVGREAMKREFRALLGAAESRTGEEA